MTRLIALALGLCAGLSTMALAEGRERIGYGLIFTNDVIGDTKDRWRTGSVASSRVWADGWNGAAPAGVGDLLEFRFNGEVIAPEDLSRPAVQDRPFVGALSFGLHTHFKPAWIEYSAGADLIVTGSQTGLDDFQDFIHDIVGERNISGRVRRNQVDNAFRPAGVFEAGREFSYGMARIRPFAEARVGVEDLVRAGADITIGMLTRNELMIREPVTGQRYRAVRADRPGLAFVLGGDIAYVDNSDYLPARSGITITEDRARLRGGAHWEGRRGGSLFYGVTWLSEEFDQQSEGQVVGSVQFRLRF
ncbi:MAG: DUF2219 family protein [Roseovarius sp.]|jgi:hypothetical protein|nr:DUF2219 family protein [Roseovarius sp.]